MYTVLIADDEQLERQALRYILNDSCPQLEIVGEVGDGASAVSQALLLRPDIVIMDIRMPEMNGLEAARAIREVFPSSAIIMLTAFDEFEYAKQALKFGAVEYLLKPLRPVDLVKALEAVIEQVARTKEQERQHEQVRKNLKEAEPYIKMSFVQDLIAGNVTEAKQFKERSDFLCIDLTVGVVMVLDIDNFMQLTQRATELDKQIVKQQIYLLTVAATGKNALVTPFSSDHIIVIAGLSDGQPPEAGKCAAVALAERIRQTVFAKTGMGVTIGIGRVYDQPADICKSYLEAVSAQRQRFYLGDHQMIHIDDIVHLQDQPFYYPFQNERAVLDGVRCGDRKQAKQALALLLEELFAHNGTIEIVKASVLELLIVLSRAAAEGGASLEQLTLLNFEHIHRLMKCVSKQQVHSWLFDSLDSFLDNMLDNRNTANVRVINKACDFIIKNCHKNISLEEVAQTVHLSPFYFSRLFKQDKGCNFVDFVTATRIEKAKRMLQSSDYTIVKIASESGYHDASYFCRVFRQEVGLTPNQYRKQPTLL